MFLFLSWVDFFDLDQATSVVVYVADERAPFSAGRDKAAQNVDIIVQRSVHRLLNIQQIFGKHGIALFTQVVAPAPAPDSLLMGSSCPFSKARQAAFLSVAPALCVSLPSRLQDTDNCRHVSAPAKMGKVLYCIRWIYICIWRWALLTIIVI